MVSGAFYCRKLGHTEPQTKQKQRQENNNKKKISKLNTSRLNHQTNSPIRARTEHPQRVGPINHAGSPRVRSPRTEPPRPPSGRGLSSNPKYRIFRRHEGRAKSSCAPAPHGADPALGHITRPPQLLAPSQIILAGALKAKQP